MMVANDARILAAACALTLCAASCTGDQRGTQPDAGDDVSADAADADATADPPERMTSLGLPSVSFGRVLGLGPEYDHVSNGPPALFQHGMYSDLLVAPACGDDPTKVTPRAFDGARPDVAASSDGQTLVADRDDSVLRSTDDGQNWTDVSEAAPENIRALGAGGGQFYAVANASDGPGVSIYVSPDGASWTEAYAGIEGDAFWDINAAGDEIFVEATPADTLHVSRDGGSTWTSQANFSGPDMPWAKVGEDYYATDSGTLLRTSSDGLNWSDVEDEDVPRFGVGVDTRDGSLLLLNSKGTLAELSEAEGDFTVSRSRELGPIPGESDQVGVVGCEGSVAISTPRGLLRVELDGDISSWGARSQATVDDAVGTSGAAMVNRQLIRDEGAWFFVKDRPGSVTEFSQYVNLAWEEELYAGGLDTSDRGILYRRTESNAWEPIASDTQTTTCQHGGDCEDGDPMRQIPSSVVTFDGSTLVGFKGRVETSGSSVSIDGGGIVRADGPDASEPFNDGLPTRRCQGSETTSKATASHLCPAGIKDMTVLEDAWVATGDPHTDTYEVFRRSPGDDAWRPAHAGLPGPVEDSTPLNEDMGRERTEADFAVADGTLFIATYRYPANEVQVHWFHGETDRWWPMPSGRLDGDEFLELMGHEDSLFVGSKSNLWGWTDVTEKWQNMTVGSNLRANSLYLTPDERILTGTDSDGLNVYDVAF
jgi:photosystem II stability/assembly factor-like uncharacterized protein